jgi:hypothetical protein
MNKYMTEYYSAIKEYPIRWSKMNGTERHLVKKIRHRKTTIAFSLSYVDIKKC